MNMKFIDYSTMNDRYSIADAAALLEISSDMLWFHCMQNGICPRLNKHGEIEISKYELRSIHNKLYHKKGRITATDLYNLSL